MSGRSDNLPVLVCLLGAIGLHALLVPMAARLMASNFSPLPDLRVAGLEAPDEAARGDRVAVRFVVRNVGPGNASGDWTDGLYLSRDHAIDDADAVLQTWPRTQGLSSEAEYARQFTVQITPDMDGPYYLIAAADAEHQIQQARSAEAKTATQAIWVESGKAAHVEVTAIDAPAYAIAGGYLSATLRVANRGPGYARPPWIDALYLSADATLDEADHLLGERRHSSALPPDEDYPVNITAMIPRDAEGPMFLLAQTRDNRVTSQPIEIDTLGLPDLAVTSADAPPRIIAGEEASIAFRVANHGSESTADRSWTDRVYLSMDATRSEDDTVLVESPNPLPLEPGQHYKSGPHVIKLGEPTQPTAYLLVVADANDVVFEDTHTDNNVLAIPFEWVKPDDSDELTLGRDEPSPPLAVAWISHDDLQKLQARPSATEQPALQTKMDPVPDAPPIIDPAPPSVEVKRPADPQAPIVADRPPTQTTEVTPVLDAEPAETVTEPSPDAQVAAAAIGGQPSLRLDPAESGDPVPIDQPRSPRPEPSEGTIEEPAGEAVTGAEQPTEGQNPDRSPSTKPSETESTKPSEDKEPAPPTVTTQQPREGGTPTSAARSDREAPPTQLSPDMVDVQPGKVVTVEGIEIKTSAPRFSAEARSSAQPFDPVARVTFDKDGTVIDVELIHVSGAENVDSPVLNALYRWKASGKKLEDLDGPFFQVFKILLRGS